MKKITELQLIKLQDIIKKEGYLKKEVYSKLIDNFGFSDIVFKRELTNLKIPFENTNLNNFLRILDVEEKEEKFSLASFEKNGEWRKDLFKNSKVFFYYICESCKEEKSSRSDKLAQRKFYSWQPICSDCIGKKVCNTEEWRKSNSDAQFIAQNKPEQIKKNSQAQIERFKDPVVRKKASENSKKNWQDPEYRAKLEKIAQNKWSDPEYARKVIEHSKKSCIVGHYKGIYYNSSYELAFMIKFEDEGKFEKIFRADIKIKYKKKNDKMGYYYPDFIFEEKYLIEVKGYAPWVDLENLRLKNKAAKKWCKENKMSFRLVELKDFGYHYLRRAIKWHKDEIKEKNNNTCI